MMKRLHCNPTPVGYQPPATPPLAPPPSPGRRAPSPQAQAGPDQPPVRPSLSPSRRVLHWVSQVLIALLGGAAIIMVARDGEVRAWGALLGLLSQPFWVMETWRARQWGMFAISLWYCLGWGLGVWRLWS